MTLNRLGKLPSLICTGVLMLIPVLFAVAHIGADGAEWNFETGEKFSPMLNVVSSYAWRSPAGILGGHLMPDVSGLSQRVMYSGIYFWMLIVVRQIERQRLPAVELNASAKANGLDQCGQDLHVR